MVQDLLEDGTWRLGGAAAYAGLFAAKLGLRTAVLTACAEDLPLAELLPGIELARVPSERTTQMRNVYAGGHRRQWVPQRATPLTIAHLPGAWKDARTVLLGPVAGELDASIAGAFSPGTRIGVGAQGFLREIASDRSVRPVPPADWDAAPVLERAAALFLSDEDVSLEDAPVALAEWATIVDIVAFTRGYGGADVHYAGEWRRTGAFPAAPVDLTGAGDTFATGFLVRLAETGDPWDATRFGSAAASLVIEGVGVEGAPSRAAIEERLRLGPRTGVR